MSEAHWLVFTPQTAQAFGKLTTGGFLVKAGSTAIREGSTTVKRERSLRDRLVREGTLVQSTDPDLYRFAKDHVFNSASQAGGVVQDGNCSGPRSWTRRKP